MNYRREDMLATFDEAVSSYDHFNQKIAEGMDFYRNLKENLSKITAKLHELYKQTPLGQPKPKMVPPPAPTYVDGPNRPVSGARLGDYLGGSPFPALLSRTTSHRQNQPAHVERLFGREKKPPRSGGKSHLEHDDPAERGREPSILPATKCPISIRQSINQCPTGGKLRLDSHSSAIQSKFLRTAAVLHAGVLRYLFCDAAAVQWTAAFTASSKSPPESTAKLSVSNSRGRKSRSTFISSGRCQYYTAASTHRASTATGARQYTGAVLGIAAWLHWILFR